MTLNSKQLTIVILSILIIGIGAAKIGGFWRTESSKIPQKFSTGEFKGNSNPADIRGSYSFGDISNSFDIPVDALAAAFGVISETPAEFKCKELESIFSDLPVNGEIGTDSVRYFTALYTGLPFEPEDTTYLLSQSMNVLKDILTQDQKEELRPHLISITDIDTTDARTSAAEHDTSSAEIFVKGNTTFADLYSWGLTKEKITEIIGSEPGARGSTVRSYCMDLGIEFSTVKEPLQQALDQMNSN